MAKKKEKSPEKVESEKADSVEKVEVASEVAQPEAEHHQHADLAKHPKFDKFKSHGGKLND